MWQKEETQEELFKNVPNYRINTPTPPLTECVGVCVCRKWGKTLPSLSILAWSCLALPSKSNLCVALYVWQCSSILPVDLVYGQVVNRRRRRRWVVSSFLDPIVKEPFPSFLPTCHANRPHGPSASSLAAGCICGVVVVLDDDATWGILRDA